MDSRHIIRGKNTKKQGTKGFMSYRKYFNGSGFFFEKMYSTLIEFHMHLQMKVEKNEKFLITYTTKDGRSMTTFYYCSVNHQSGLQRNKFSKLEYIFLIHQNVPQIMSFYLRYMMVS